MLAILTGLPANADASLPSPSAAPSANAERLLHLVRSGAFVEALREPLALQLLQADDSTSQQAAERARSYLQSVAPDERSAAATCVQAIGAAALSLFAHANWMGARVCRPSPVVPLAASRCDAALSALSVDGEAAYGLLDAPSLLCAARALLVDVLDDLSSAAPAACTAPWWAARCLVLHQRSLEQHAPSLEKAATKAMRRALAALEALALTAVGAEEDGAPGAESSSKAGAGAAAAGSSLSGQTVTVVGLEARPELNGQRGKVGTYDASKGRYAVQLDGMLKADSIMLKADNLVLASATTSAAATAGDASAASALPAAPVALATAALSPDYREALALAHAELSQLLLLHRRTVEASAELQAAKQVLGLSFELTGALGRRTKFQERSISQLYLRSRHAPHALPREDERAAAEQARDAALPHCVVEEDEDLLNRTEYEVASAGAADPKHTGSGEGGGEGSGESATDTPVALSAIEQTVLMCECNWIQAERPTHESTLEELETYVVALLRAPRTWAGATHALRLKAKMESSRKRRQHQALMQLQTLLDDVRPPEAADGITLMARHMGEVEAAPDADEPGAGAASISSGAGAASISSSEAAAAPPAPPPPAPPDTTLECGRLALRLRPPDTTLACGRLALRLRGLWAINLAPRWQLGAEVARALAALGLLTEASSLFAELELWEEFVLAMGALGHKAKAEEYAPSPPHPPCPLPSPFPQPPHPTAAGSDDSLMTTLLTLLLTSGDETSALGCPKTSDDL